MHSLDPVVELVFPCGSLGDTLTSGQSWVSRCSSKLNSHEDVHRWAFLSSRHLQRHLSPLAIKVFTPKKTFPFGITPRTQHGTVFLERESLCFMSRCFIIKCLWRVLLKTRSSKTREPRPRPRGAGVSSDTHSPRGSCRASVEPPTCGGRSGRRGVPEEREERERSQICDSFLGFRGCTCVRVSLRKPCHKEEAKDQPASDKIGFPFFNLFHL